MHALADFIAEHGERGLRAVGGRRAAEKWLAEQHPGLDVPELQRGSSSPCGEPADMTRIVLPGEPLIDGATALRPWRDSDLKALVRRAETPRSSAGRACRATIARRTAARI